MDFAAIASVSPASRLQAEVGVRVLDKALEAAGAAFLRLMEGLEGPLNPSMGSVLDVSV